MSSTSAFAHESRLSPATQAGPIVFVVDDDASVRESVASLVSAAGWQAQVFATAEEFLSWPRAVGASCLVLDVSLPDLNGLELQQRIAGEQLDIPIVFITGHGSVPMTVKAMRAGAMEFLTKPFHGDVLLRAISQALERSQASLLQKARRRELLTHYASLTPRERQVMSLVVRGCLNKQIAAELGISEVTVKAHRGHMMQKMAALSLPHLVNMASALDPELDSRVAGEKRG